jgi:hypothetical protein
MSHWLPSILLVPSFEGLLMTHRLVALLFLTLALRTFCIAPCLCMRGVLVMPRSIAAVEALMQLVHVLLSGVVYALHLIGGLHVPGDVAVVPTSVPPGTIPPSMTWFVKRR